MISLIASLDKSAGKENSGSSNSVMRAQKLGEMIDESSSRKLLLFAIY
jgi:hypothetical protein